MNVPEVLQKAFSLIRILFAGRPGKLEIMFLFLTISLNRVQLYLQLLLMYGKIGSYF